LAARRTAQTGQAKETPTKRDSAPSVCSFHHEHTAEFAVIAKQYEYLRERMDAYEKSLTEGLASIRQYLKEDYAQAIENRISMLSLRLDAAERQITEMHKSIDALSKKIISAMGGIAVLTFLMGIAATLVAGFLGGK
jgi:chromosome segregation ATPase